MRLGLHQESIDRFSFAIHADAEPARTYTEFRAGDLRARWTEQTDGSQRLELTGENTTISQARRTFLQRAPHGTGALVEAAVMALETASDSWLFTLLRNDMPGYHVALAFSFVPLAATMRADGLTHVPFEVVGNQPQDLTWRILHPALVGQAAEIVCPDVLTGADACARLASQPGVIDYLVALGDTFNLADIERLARMGQSTSSTVIAAARGFRGEDHTWLYRIRLSRRAIASAERLAVIYERAKARHASSLRARVQQGMTEQQRKFHEAQIERFAHHLAVLQLCWEFGIGLSSCPMRRSEDSVLDDVADESDDWDAPSWSIAAPLEQAR